MNSAMIEAIVRDYIKANLRVVINDNTKPAWATISGHEQKEYTITVALGDEKPFFESSINPD